MYMCIYTCVRVCVQTSKRFSVKESRARAARKLRCLRLCLCLCVCVGQDTKQQRKFSCCIEELGWVCVSVCVWESGMWSRGRAEQVAGAWGGRGIGNGEWGRARERGHNFFS